MYLKRYHFTFSSSAKMTKNVKNVSFPLVLLFVLVSDAAAVLCRGSCGAVLEESSLPNCRPESRESCLQVSPYSSSMLGGRPLTIVGFIPDPKRKLSCRFKGEIERPGFIDRDGHASCVTPLLFETGWIRLDISTDGTDYDQSGEYLSVHPSRAGPASQVTLVDVAQWQNYSPLPVEDLRITWNCSLIPAERVNVELWGYREIAKGNESSAELGHLYSLGRNVSNSGNFSFTPEPRGEFSDYQLGNIRVTAGSRSEGERDVEALWSPGHVLAWRFEQAFRDDPVAWARDKCLQWDELEQGLPDFLDELVECPCTLAQARADTGRFHTDYSCNLDTGSVCTYHPGAVHCVRAIQPSPNHGSGQQCCYDRSGSLVLTADSIGGSTPDRAHDWGSPPYVRPPRVPGYSHWLYDVMSFYYCCLWSDHCHVYFKHRPSSGCRSYRPPRAAVVLGHLHFLTLNGFSYTFNGKGEYHLLSAQDAELSVQARTEQVKLLNGSLAKATRLSSVAMKERSSCVMEVRLMGDHSLQVLRNQRLVPFTEQRLMGLQGVFVLAPDPQHVSLMFSSGVGVELRVDAGAMAATLLLPPELSNHTRGLLALNIPAPSQSSTPHFREEIFAVAARCNISKESSLFTYDTDELLDSYHSQPSHDSSFIPVFTPPESPDDPLLGAVLDLCAEEERGFCKHDSLVTRSLEKGNATLRALQSHRALIQDLEPVVSCDSLPAPPNGEKNGTQYLEGDTVTFSCSRGFTLFGSNERTCTTNGTWTGEQPHCVRDDVVGLVLGTVGSLSALIAMAITIRLQCRKQKREPKDGALEMVTQVQAF